MYYKMLKLKELVKAKIPFPVKVEQPHIIFSFDDGRETDFTVVFPILREEGIVAETCVITEKIGQPGYLDIQRLITLEKAGWEVVSHTKRHNPLNTCFIIQPSCRGDNFIHIEYPYRYQPGSRCVLQNGYKQEAVEVTFSDQKRLFLADKLKNSYARYSPFRLSEEQASLEVIDSKRYLQSHGLQTENFTFPYNAYARWSVELVRKHYCSARIGAKTAIFNNSLGGYNRYLLASVNFEQNKLRMEQAIRLLDSLIITGGVCFFHAHSSGEYFNPEFLRFIIRTAKERKIRFTIRRNL